MTKNYRNFRNSGLNSRHLGGSGEQKRSSNSQKGAMNNSASRINRNTQRRKQAPASRACAQFRSTTMQSHRSDRAVSSRQVSRNFEKRSSAGKAQLHSSNSKGKTTRSTTRSVNQSGSRTPYNRSVSFDSKRGTAKTATASSARKSSRSNNNVPQHNTGKQVQQNYEKRQGRRREENAAKRQTVSARKSLAQSKKKSVAQSAQVGGKKSASSQRNSSTRRQSAYNSTISGNHGIPANVLKDPTKNKYTSESKQPSNTSSNKFFHITSFLWSKSKLLSCAIVLLLVVLVGGVTDSLINMNKIYAGVSVGGIDLSGKTVDEATQLISQEYEPRLSENNVVFCANEQALEKAQNQTATYDSLDEQISYEESLSSRDRWTIDAQHLGATLDPHSYAEQAFQVGRETGGLLTRIQSQLSGFRIDVECSFNATSFDEMRDEIIAALGTKMVNFNVEIEDGVPTVTNGNDGYEVSEQWLQDKLNYALLNGEGSSYYVIDMQDVGVQIDWDGANSCAQIIETSLAKGLDFTYEDASWHADPSTLASWITTEVRQVGQSNSLVPLFNKDLATPDIVSGFGLSYGGSNYSVYFTNTDGEISVQTNAEGSVPQVRGALDELNESFFVQEAKDQTPQKEVAAIEIPETMSFDEACDYGLVSKISSFTTQYASGAEARNNNIHVAADSLTNSICKGGQDWSFLALSGETTEEKGYQGAGAIIGGEYSDAIGGGICQVATTVFNAVYESGFPVTKRYNHSLYIASYPQGRDAAIAYPELDLIWQNDTESDVLLVMSYTNSSVTATLYGVDPGYEVSTTYGEWKEGEAYKKLIRQDSNYPTGTEFVETSGTNGRSITIVQTVKDKDGNVLREQEFSSTYKPKNEIVVQGTA